MAVALPAFSAASSASSSPSAPSRRKAFVWPSFHMSRGSRCNTASARCLADRREACGVTLTTAAQPKAQTSAKSVRTGKPSRRMRTVSRTPSEFSCASTRAESKSPPVCALFGLRQRTKCGVPLWSVSRRALAYGRLSETSHARLGRLGSGSRSAGLAGEG